MKTQRTLEIEKLLTYYHPEYIAGCKLNSFRNRYLAFECPVECGTTAAGMVDCVRVDETLVLPQNHWVCSPGNHKNWYLENNPEVFKYAQNKGCPFDRIEDLPEGTCPDYCGECSLRAFRKEYVNEILITAYEIKVTKDDFHSNHGHNFIGNANFYVMPKELYQQVKGEIPDHVGVIVHQVTDKINGLRKVKEAEYQWLPDTRVKWLLMSVLKKQQSFYDPPKYYSEDMALYKEEEEFSLW